MSWRAGDESGSWEDVERISNGEEEPLISLASLSLLPIERPFIRSPNSSSPAPSSFFAEVQRGPS